jgi:hypothetical protein
MNCRPSSSSLSTAAIVAPFLAFELILARRRQASLR